jgi:serine/threonine-protein kinase
MAVVTGQTFGNYQVVRLLGEGGFGEVYEAENPFLQRRAAIKVLHKGMVEDPELVRRFLNEARAASAIRHPNIIEVLDAGVTPEGEPYILMEFLEGDSLQKRMLQQGRMPIRLVQEITRQAGSALSAAHLAGIVHRDLKPENLFLVPDPASPMGFRVKVLDFGIAKVKHREDRAATVKTQAGLLMGSPAYMSPEQCRDSSDVDHRSDIYSLGIMVYEMLAGVPPFASKSATEMLVLQLTASPASLRSQVPDIPEYVEQTVMRALAKDRDQRYDSVDYFVGALLGTYPALTTQGSASFAGNDSTNRNQPTPAPVSVSDPSIGTAPTPAPVFAPSPNVTTLSRATGEAASSPITSASDADMEGVRPKRWPIVAAVGAVAAGLALFLVLRPGVSPAPVAAGRTAVPDPASGVAPSVAPNALVRIRLGSSPAGATVVDDKDGSVLGQTPLEKAYPRGNGVLGVVLRLAGHNDKSVAISLGGDSATSVELEPLDAVRAEDARTPAPAHAEHHAVGARKSPSKPMRDKEDEWRVH